MPKGTRAFFRFATSYATRSLLLNPRRSLLTILTVMLSVTVAIIANRYSAAVLNLWEEGATNTGIAHAQIHAKGYWEKPDGMDPNLLLQADNALEKLVASDPSVESISRRLEFEGIISARDKTVYFLGFAIDPDDELKVSPQLFSPTDVGQFVNNSDLTGVTLGKGLAQSLDLKIGDEATLKAQTIDGSVNGIGVIVRGIVDLPVPALSKRVVYIHRAHANEVLQAGGKYSELAIRLKKSINADLWVAATRASVNQAGGALRGWWEIDTIIRNVERIWSSIIGVISFLLFISAGISVLNIIFMVVAERTIEIGTLMAIGAKKADIRRLFTWEAIVIGLVGGLGGVVVGNGIVLLMGYVGVPFDSPFSSGFVTVFPKVNLLETMVILCGAVIICLAAAFFPSRKAASVEPVRAFKGQVV